MDKITPVKIVETQNPIPVVVEEIKPPDKLVTKDSGQTLAPTTTEEQDKVREGQRTVNLIWERTQRAIAIFSVFSGIAINALVIGLIMALAREMTVNQLAIISMCLQFINLTAGIVIGFYFSRTNHTKTGGVAENQQSR